MAIPFVAAGVITLTTDFGQEGPFVATMKGRILSRFPQAQIIDLTHEILAHWPAEAGFWLSRAWQYFPDGSIHVAVVDPGVGTSRDLLAVATPTHLFLAPDNGLLAPVIGRLPDPVVYRLHPRVWERLGLKMPSATFHGRDIFAPVAAELASGRAQLTDLATPVREYVPGWVEDPEVTPAGVRGVVITLDNFGNLVTNIDHELLHGIARPVIVAGGHRLALRNTYGDVQPGEYVALINSFGVVEIARAEQSAAEGLGLGRGAPVQIVPG